MAVMFASMAVPIGMTHTEISADAPVWVDAAGNEYKVASGYINVSGNTAAKTANSRGICVIIGVSGMEALTSMGLSPKQMEEESAE